MKVITPGRPQKGWAKEYTCTGAGNGNGGCGAVLLIEQDDVYETSGSCRDETNYYTTFKCSECGVETDIIDVPGNLKLPTKESWARRHPKKLSCIHRFENGERCTSPALELSNHCYKHR
jgi:hypothetical protein